MLTPSKEFLGVFIPLSANDLAKLCQDAMLRGVYLDGIAFMNDLVTPYTDNPTSSYFDSEEAKVSCGVIKEKYFNSKDTLSKHFRHNFETAVYFSSQGQSTIGAESIENIKRMNKDATAYVNALLHTYNIVRTTENLESENTQILELVGQITGTERLKSLRVTEVMMPFELIQRIDVGPAGSTDKLLINDLYHVLLRKQIRRALIFQGRKIIYVLHKSLLSDYLFRNAEPGDPLTIANMKTDSDKDIQNAFKNGVRTISKDATLLDVKNIMDLIPSCQDVFVTETGKKDEDVFGWLSNVDVLTYSA